MSEKSVLVDVDSDRWEEFKEKLRREQDRWTITEFFDLMLRLYINGVILLTKEDTHEVGVGKLL
jgi:hypothetical protein